jgi:hypothetical protein
MKYDAVKEDFSPLVNWRILEATPSRPAVAVGISSSWPLDDDGGGMLFVTAAQLLGERISGSASLSFGLKDDKFRTPASLSYTFTDSFSATLFHDGKKLHPLVTFDRAPGSLSLILLRGEDPAISMSWGF